MKREELAALRLALRPSRTAPAAPSPPSPPSSPDEPPDDATAFRLHVGRHLGRITPLTPSPRVAHASEPPQPVPRQRLLDERAALSASLSDDFDVESLLDTDDALSFRRDGVGPDVPRKLRRGQWALQAQIDLHGLTRDDARDALAAFIAQAAARGQRCLRVVHGKGIGSPGRTPVLKSKVRAWLVQNERVLAFVQAPRAQGGHGALLVLLA